MVAFPPACLPTPLAAYPNAPLASTVHTAVVHDFNVGSFARFRDPGEVLEIHDRPEFHGLSHLEMRLRLDAERQEDGFVVIDEETAALRAVWWITPTEESEYINKDMTEAHDPPVSYPGEAFPLWKVHILTQDLPIQWANWDIGNTDPVEDIHDISPYDPHDPQNPPYTLGLDFSKKDDAKGFYIGPYVTAAPGEWEWSDDPALRRRVGQELKAVVRLREEAAKEAGLIPDWYPW